MSRDIVRYVQYALQPITRRIRMMVARGVVRVVYDGLKMQGLQASFMQGEVKDGLEHFQPYGFTHHPHAGAEAVAVFLGGNRDHGIVIVVDDRRYRLKPLAAGEVALYDDLGQMVHLKRNGAVVKAQNIHLNADGVLRLEGDGVEIHGRTYLQEGVQGKGQRETWAGGTDYNVDSYTTGASGGSTEHGLNQPAIPSDHPDA